MTLIELPRAADAGQLVPKYTIYGESQRISDWTVNAEPLGERCRQRGWIITAHTHPHMTQIVYCTRGRGEMILDGESIPFHADCVMVVPPHRIHGFCYEGDADGWVVTIENHFLDDLLHRAPQLRTVLMSAGVFHLETTPHALLAQALEALTRESAALAPDGQLGAEIQLMSTLLIMARHWPQQAQQASRRDSKAILVDRYYDVVESRYRLQPSVAELAAELRVSESQLRNSCSLVTGMSPIKILHDRVLAESKRCLAYSSLSVGEVSEALGFSDISYFSRFFKKHTSLSPSSYRSARNIASPMGR